MNTEIFKSKKLMPVLALFVALLWALAYPFIKLGYQELQIAGDDLGSKVLFAGIRFFTAGILVLLIAEKKTGIRKEDGANPWLWLMLFAFVNTFLHYIFSYIGLGYVQSSRGTVIDSSGSIILILLSCMIFADDHLTIKKIVGCILGFSGIVLINITPGQSFFENITFMGDGMIFLNTISGAFGSIISRVVSKKMNMMFATGVGMLTGGTLLGVVGILFRPARMWNLTLKGIAILIVLSLISAITFAIFNSLIANHPISKVAIFNAFIPIFGVFFACIILGEPFSVKYLIAGCLATAGTILANRR